MPVPNSNRSSSPLSSRTSPHSRNSESNSTSRRSFSGNFPKPSSLTNIRGINPPSHVNSPSGFGRRLSGGKEAEKENDHNIKTVKSWSGSNGSKNFMAPTISAAYKLTPSPRKKVLVDRNEPIRTPVSLSEGKVSFFSPNGKDLAPKSEPSMDANDSVVLERPSVSRSSKRVAFADSNSDSGASKEFGGELVAFDSDYVVTEMNSKDKSFSDSCMSPVIAPLDADPSLPPYDPRTNYLSPRPQFLRYKPNPRINVLLNKEKETDEDDRMKMLEDNFTCFENSETEEIEESPNSDDSQEDSEECSGAETETFIAKEEDLNGSETLVSDGLNANENFESINCGGSSGLQNPEKVVQGKDKEKKGLVPRLRSICVFVLLLLSCCSIYVTFPPTTNSAKIFEVFSTSKLHQPTAVVDLAKANFNVFTQRFKQFSIESLSHLSLLIDDLGHGDRMTTLQFMNLTELQNDILVGGHLSIPQGSEIYPDKNIERNDVEETLVALEEEKGDEIAEFSEDETFVDSVLESTSDSEKEIEADLVVSEALALSAAASVVADETICNQKEPPANLDTESPDDIKPEHYYVPLALEVYGVITESNPGNQGVDVHFGGNVELSSEAINLVPPSDVIHSTISELPSDTKSSFLGNLTPKRSVFYLLGATSILLASMAIAFGTFIKKKRVNGSEQNIGVDRKELLSTKTNLEKSAMEQLYQRKICSNNWPNEDDIGESCPSEMSSFRRSSSQSHHTKLRTANEVQSGEKRARKYSKRESFSSSDISSGGASPSYGSFTTYERIPIKNAAGDDEVVTPVRRSSRLIRSHATS